MATHRQQWVVQRFGANLSDAEAAVFLQSLRQEAIGPLEAASVSGLNPSETGRLLERLVQQQLLAIHPGGQGRSFRPKPIFAAPAQELSTLPGTTGEASGAVAVPGSLVTGRGDQASSKANSRPSTGSSELAEKLPETASAILAFCRAAQGGLAIMDKVGVSHRTFFKKKHLDPLIRLGFLRPTHPNKPRHPDQGYITTDAGKSLLESLVTRQGAQDAPSLVTDELTKPRPANP
jgi:ATP-dependent DNA helicase RecG